MKLKIKKIKSNNFTVIDNHILRDKNLSIKSVGLFCILWSLPDDWDFSVRGMASILKDGESCIRTAIKELQDNGYLTISRERINGKLGNSIWILSENPDVENAHEEKRHEENRSQINKEERSIDLNKVKRENNIYGDVDENVKSPRKTNKPTSRFVKPTIEEIREYCDERCNTVDVERFYDYYESNGWMVGKNKMKDWKAAVRTWERNSYGGGVQTENRVVTYHKETVGEHNMRVLAEYRRKKMEMGKIE